MEAPGLAKAATADPDPPESLGETPDGAPAHLPSSDAPSPESPAYRLQDFDTLATVGEFEARGPARRGPRCHRGRWRQTKAGVSSHGCLPGRALPGPACSGSRRRAAPAPSVPAMPRE